MTRFVFALAILSLGMFAFAADEETLPYYRQPAVSADGATVAFVYAGDIYIAPTAGGKASLLVSHDDYDSNPRFSPDGKWLAFTSTRTGTGDIYLIGLEDGGLRRLTYHGASDVVESWSPDSTWVFFSSNRADVRGQYDIYKVSIEGGTPMPVSRDRYEQEYNAAVSPDGATLAFNSNDRVRQWWRKGPVINDATEIWLKSNDPAATDYRQFTTFKGMDSYPMWAPDGGGLYYVCDDGDPRTENIWYKGLDGESRQVTSFTDGRVLWPDIAGKEGSIVFERDFGIWILRPGGTPQPIALQAFADERKNPVEAQTQTGSVSEFALSPDGKKIAFIIHGEVFAAPANPDDDAPTPNAFRVTATAAAEAGLAWSSDSNKLIYTSDRFGIPNLFVYDFVTKEEKRLTDSDLPEYMPAVSPDGNWCAYYRGKEEIRLIRLYDLSDYAFISGFFITDQIAGNRNFCWSPDSAWIAYCSTDDQYFSNVYAKKVEGGDPVQLTFLPNISGNYPIWSNDGRSIYFTTGQYRSENQVMRVDLVPIEQRFVEQQMDDLFDKPKGEEEKAEAGKEEKKEELKVAIVPEGIKDRIYREATYGENSYAVGLSPDGKYLLFANNSSGLATLWIKGVDPYLNSTKRRPRVLLEAQNGFGGIQFEKDGKKLWLLDGRTIKSGTIDGNFKPYALLAEMEVDFHAEKMQVFRDAWVKLRDHFYDVTMNNQDWPAVYQHYLPYVRGARNNTDLSYVITLMVGDLNASHLGVYYSEGGAADPTGDLGIDFDPVEYLQYGRFKVSDIIPIAPASVEKSDLAVGSYVLAIDGVELDGKVNLPELLNRKIGKRVELVYADAPDGERKTMLIKPVIYSTTNYHRYTRWIRRNEEYVLKASNGRLGYVYIPDMGDYSLERFKLDLDSQIHEREGVVIDVRYNSGGHIAPFVIDLLMRRAGMLQVFRGRGRTSASNLAGNRVLDKPTIVVQNEQSLSNAEMFAELYRRAGLGKIVGTDSNGWVIWTWGTQLLNGAYLRLPYCKVSTLEGEDLDEAPRKPDIYVERPIGQSLVGKDDQLDAAVRVLLEQIDGSR